MTTSQAIIKIFAAIGFLTVLAILAIGVSAIIEFIRK
jgi:hypothetical protein